LRTVTYCTENEETPGCTHPGDGAFDLDGRRAHRAAFVSGNTSAWTSTTSPAFVLTAPVHRTAYPNFNRTVFPGNRRKKSEPGESE